MSHTQHFLDCLTTSERIAALEALITIRPSGAARWAEDHDRLTDRTLELVSKVKRALCDQSVTPRRYEKLDDRLLRHLEQVPEDEAAAAHEIMYVFGMAMQAAVSAPDAT